MATTTRSKPRKAPRRSRKPGTQVRHTCGHAQAHVLKGKTWQKDREKVRLAERPCTHCWAREQAEASEALCGVENLPELSGTEGRVLWARTIRANWLGRVLGEASVLDRVRHDRGLTPAKDRYMALAVPALLGKGAAKWWVDHREDPDLLDQALSLKAQKGLEAILQETEASACPF